MGDYEGTFIDLSYQTLSWTDEQGEQQNAHIHKKAARKLKHARAGDRIRFTMEFERYSIVKARIHTGSLEQRVELLEAALAAAGIPIPTEAAPVADRSSAAYQ